jgi:Putative zinc-finger
MMKEMNNPATCERADDLVSVLYGEASEREQREFEFHVKQCASCRAEFAAFTEVREAIGEWRDEALNGFVSSPVVAAPSRKSAVAALRQFFDLSPLWMKGAVGFAALVFCVLVVLAFGRLSSSPNLPQFAVNNPQTGYTKEDVDRAVKDALEKQAALARSQREPLVIEVAKPKTAVTSAAKDSTLAKSAPRSQRPFSRAEREQLAAELRLVSAAEETDLESPDK